MTIGLTDEEKEEAFGHAVDSACIKAVNKVYPEVCQRLLEVAIKQAANRGFLGGVAWLQSEESDEQISIEENAILLRKRRKLH